MIHVLEMAHSLGMDVDQVSMTFSRKNGPFCESEVPRLISVRFVIPAVGIARVEMHFVWKR